MAVTAHVYTKFANRLGQKGVDIDTDTWKCMLLSAYTVGTTQDTAEFAADVLAVATEASGTGYTAGGATLTSVSWTASGHVYTFTATIPAWNAAGGSLAAAYALFIDTTPGTNATNPVMCYWDLGGTQTATNGTFTLTASGTGILTVTGT
jgi:hypothetical protein